MHLEKTKPSLQTCNFENEKLMYIQGTKTRLAKKTKSKKQKNKICKKIFRKNRIKKKTRTRSPKTCIPTNINLMQKFD